jgi:HAD superfamily hydrolase (TIGR01509 family)
MLRCVLFDLDDVLVDYDRSIRVGHLAQAIDSTPEAVRSAIYGSGIEDAADRGALTPQAYLDALGAQVGRAISVEDWTMARRAATQARPEVVALAHRLALRMSVALLTNNGVLMAQQLPQIVPALFPLLAGRAFASAEFGASKPDPRVYVACLERLGVLPGATLFVDDNEANVQGAISAGLHGHHYRDLRGLSTALATFGFH